MVHFKNISPFVPMPTSLVILPIPCLPMPTSFVKMEITVYYILCDKIQPRWGEISICTKNKNFGTLKVTSIQFFFN